MFPGVGYVLHAGAAQRVMTAGQDLRVDGLDRDLSAVCFPPPADSSLRATRHFLRITIRASTK